MAGGRFQANHTPSSLVFFYCTCLKLRRMCHANYMDKGGSRSCYGGSYIGNPPRESTVCSKYPGKDGTLVISKLGLGILARLYISANTLCRFEAVRHTSWQCILSTTYHECWVAWAIHTEVKTNVASLCQAVSGLAGCQTTSEDTSCLDPVVQSPFV